MSALAPSAAHDPPGDQNCASTLGHHAQHRSRTLSPTGDDQDRLVDELSLCTFLEPACSGQSAFCAGDSGVVSRDAFRGMGEVCVPGLAFRLRDISMTTR